MNRFAAFCLFLFAAPSYAGQDLPATAPIAIDQAEADLENILPYGKICKESAKDPISVSLVALIANPEKYEGKAVEVIGYYHTGGSPFHRYRALFLSEADYTQAIIRNSIWVELSGNTEIKNGFALISGIFTQSINGDFGAWGAGICNITYRPWNPKSSVHGPEA